MGTRKKPGMQPNILELSRRFFHEVAGPIVASSVPQLWEQGAFGLFGYGSDALGLDDSYSRDHHFGLRIDALAPSGVVETTAEPLRRGLAAQLPVEWEGVALRAGHVDGTGIALESRESFLNRTLGLSAAPSTPAEWLSIPEEDIIHVVNGEVWRDSTRGFLAVREAFSEHWPEPVRLRRIAHACRMFSGMGVYALHRAILRGNTYYATTRVAAALRWGIQLAFLLDRTWYPYDKWLMARFDQLPRMAERMRKCVDTVLEPDSSWNDKEAALNAIARVLDQTLVDDGIIQPHPVFAGTPTSGCRLLEHAYAEIVRGLPREMVGLVPRWEQEPLESFHARYVADLPEPVWHGLLGLHPEAGD